MPWKYIGPPKPDAPGDELAFHCRCGILHTTTLGKQHFEDKVPRWRVRCNCGTLWEIILITDPVQYPRRVNDKADAKTT